jgi:hypothetical protein
MIMPIVMIRRRLGCMRRHHDSDADLSHTQNTQTHATYTDSGTARAHTHKQTSPDAPHSWVYCLPLSFQAPRGGHSHLLPLVPLPSSRSPLVLSSPPMFASPVIHHRTRRWRGVEVARIFEVCTDHYPPFALPLSAEEYLL